MDLLGEYNVPATIPYDAFYWQEYVITGVSQITFDIKRVFHKRLNIRGNLFLCMRTFTYEQVFIHRQLCGRLIIIFFII